MGESYCQVQLIQVTVNYENLTQFSWNFVLAWLWWPSGTQCQLMRIILNWNSEHVFVANPLSTLTLEETRLITTLLTSALVKLGQVSKTLCSMSSVKRAFDNLLIVNLMISRDFIITKPSLYPCCKRNFFFSYLYVSVELNITDGKGSSNVELQKKKQKNWIK